MDIPVIDYSPEQNKKHKAIDEAKTLVQQSSDHLFNIEYLQNKHGLTKDDAESCYKSALNFAKNKIATFWIVELGRDMRVKSITLNKPAFIDFLTKQGVFRMPLNNKDDIYVLIENHVVEEINDRIIKEIVVNYINTLPDKFDLITKDQLMQFIMSGAATYFSKALLDFLPAIEEGKIINGVKFKWNKDTRRHSFHYFKNCFIVVDSDGIKKLQYSDLYNFIWKSQILERNFEMNEARGDYRDFIYKICSNEDARFNYLRSVIGYLLHSYKNKAKLWCIVLGDEDLSEDANGGTGKGLFWQGIGKFKELCKIDGKGFSFGKSFAFKRVKVSTQIILFDDIDKTFDFEKLFSLITEGIPVEYKNKDEFYIPFEDSAKIGITTNYLIKSRGTSVQRRKLDVELSNYFNPNNTPEDEYGKLLFDDWENDEWAKFNRFMIVDCLQYYLQNGIQKYDSSHSRLKILLSNTSRMFVPYAETEITIGTKINRSDFVKKYIDIVGYKVSTQSIMGYVREYAKYKNGEVVETHSGNDYYFTVTNSLQYKIETNEKDGLPF